MSVSTRHDERTVAWILLAVIFGEGFWVIWSFVDDPHRFVTYLGFAPNRSGTILGWLLGAIVAAGYIWSAAKIPAVRENLFRPTSLKVLAVVAAAMAAILEEVIFRKWVMDYFASLGASTALQVLASGVAFGLAHAVWGFIRLSVNAALQAVIGTTILGSALGLVYVLSDRSLAACVVAHFLISALIEPGLVLAAVRGQLGLRAAGA